VFTDAYDSEDIGFFQVSKLNLVKPFTCESSDVHSKCGLLSNEVKAQTKITPADDCLDPLPESVVKVLKMPTVSQTTALLTYKRAFKNHPNATWFCYSLGQPGRDT
jgi:hypothetical protein